MSRRMGNYEIGETLGTGMSAKVKLGRDLSTGESVALKLIDRSKLNERSTSQLHREVEAMKTIHHPNVLDLKHVDMHAVYPNSDGTATDVILLVLELAAGGELFDFMMYTGAFSEDIARTYFIQLLTALQSCHANNIYHRDIKPENLLLDSTFQLKLADFGLSSVQDSSTSTLFTECGTRSYMAPEVMTGAGYSGAKADIWSAGVVLFIMLAGNPPFQIANTTDWWYKAVSTNRHDRFWAAHLRSCPAFPELARSLLNRVFVKDIDARAGLDDLLNDPWTSKTLPLSQEQLFQDMSRRRGDVQAAKEREKLAAKAQRQQQNKGANDPFARSTQRSTSDITNHAPLIRDDELAVDCIYSSHHDANELLSRLSHVLSSSSSSSDFVICATVTHEDTHDEDLPPLSVSLQAKVMETRDGVLLIKFEKVAGDVFVFKQTIENVREQLKDVIVARIPVAFIEEDEVTTI